MTRQERGKMLSEIPRDPVIHLYRGSPYVRVWSKYQATDPSWSLCGIPRNRKKHDLGCVEEHSQVSCGYCLQLMGLSEIAATEAR